MCVAVGDKSFCIALHTKDKAIWIDLDNSPHVPLFAPIIRHYRESGVEVVVTARDHSQTIELLELHGFGGTYTVVGSHYGKSKLNKVRGLLIRTKQLVSHIKKLEKPIAVAVSHGSRSMVLVAKWLKIPVITMYDYEWTETRIFNIFSDKVLIPDRIPDRVLNEIGLPIYKRVKYPGIKEELYVSKFQATADFRRRFSKKYKEYGIADDEGQIIVLLRPPATTANYHIGRGDVMLNALLQFSLNSKDTFTVILPRTKEQASEINIEKRFLGLSYTPHVIVSEVIDGLEIANIADLVISGGGTMNREAALLGVPVYSIFAGRQGALDAQMEREGLITFIRNEEDVAKIKLIKRNRDERPAYASGLTDRVERFVIEQIDSFL